MSSTELQYVSNENGQAVAVIIPIELWREIASEKETAYLLKSKKMGKRLAAAMKRGKGLPMEKVIEKLGI
jgi:PHD/YefM family antitoxin component YafN of YafNO toxin-antitoxin module